MHASRQDISPEECSDTEQGQLESLPRVMIAAPHGKSGKTILVAGLLRALKNRGVDVQPFKKGPDYIDPGWHSVAAGKYSRNLDSLFMDAPAMRAVLREASQGVRVQIIEGAMGLFDGSDLAGSSSSAEVAKQTKTPVILVLDVTRMTRTAAALVKGCMDFDPDVSIVGVVINHVGTKRHEARIREAIEHFCGIPVVGAIPEDERLAVSDRHLGLVTSVETDAADAILDGVAEVIEEHVDINAIIALADAAPPICCPGPEVLYPSQCTSEPVTIAVIRDRVFEFYYQENLIALERSGAQLTFVDSLRDSVLPPNVSGLYIGGGFPEVFAQELQANASLRESIKAALDKGMPCCAECGGLMYLAKTLIVDGEAYDMVGALDMDIEMFTKRQGHGYSEIVVQDNHPWLAAGTTLICHEHHHSRAVRIGDSVSFAYANTRGKGIVDRMDGACMLNTVAGYAHINAIASPDWAPGFVNAAAAYSTQEITD